MTNNEATSRRSRYDLRTVEGAQQYYDRAMRRPTAGARAKAYQVLAHHGYTVADGIVRSR